MAYISPNSTIRVMKNVPLPESGVYSVWWNSASEQESYFSGKTAYTLNEYTYTRKERNVVKVGLTMDQVYGCNYMAFKNTSYENKWFYAFITDAEYINDGCTALHFRVDDMQTWWDELKHSTLFGMVKRCHSSTDEIGDNTVPEDISINGDYIQVGNKELKTTAGDDLTATACIAAICDTTQEMECYSYDRVLSGSQLYAFSNTDDGATALQDLLKQYINKPEAIVCLYMCPFYLTNNRNSGDPMKGKTLDTKYITDDAISDTAPFGLSGMYVPKNKKLYTYPYNYYCLSNGEASLTLRYEWFASLTPTFRLTGNCIYPPTMTARPTKYGIQGATAYDNDTGVSHTQALTLNNYPQCSFACDSFANWASQNFVPGVISTVAQVGSALAVNALTGNAIGTGMTIANVISNVAGGITDAVQASRSADICSGSASSTAEIADDAYGFYGCRMCVDEDTCQMVDYYFTKYGYMQHKLMTINPDVRPSFYHVETEQLNLNKPEIPAEAQQNICDRFDNGVTFWKDPDQIGAFNLDNSV